MRAFGLYLAEIVLGGARDPRPAVAGGSPGEVAPLDARTLAAWRAWAARGASGADPAPPAGERSPGPLPAGRLRPVEP